MRVNFFTPLPPQGTEIANHSAALLPALSRSLDLRVWTDQKDFTAPDPAIPVIQFDHRHMDWGDLHSADVNIYNLGNNADFHRGIYEVSRRVPGVVILHDTRLQHFFGRYAIGDAEDRAFYMALLGRTHGRAAVEDAETFLRNGIRFDVLVDRYPMTLAAVEHALAVVVHNPREAAAITQDTLLPVCSIPLAAPIVPRRPRCHGGAVTRLLVCGFIGTNRRLSAILEALDTLPERDSFHLDVFGRLEQPDEAAQHIAQYGLQNIVTLHGFVDDATLDAALDRADLAINLRYPTMGEASASQLRMWSAALPSLVTRTGWYATLPDSTVFFIDPEREVADIQAHLRALRRDPHRFAEAGQAGRARLEAEHTPDAYAAQLSALLHRPDLFGPAAATLLGRRSMERALDFATPRDAQTLARSTSRAIQQVAYG